MLSEKQIEQYLVKRVKEMGGKAYKFVSPGYDGVPDRLVCFPGGVVEFVELKAPGKKPSMIQLKQHSDFEKLGHEVWIIDSLEGVNSFISIMSFFCKPKKEAGDLVGI